MVKVEGAISIAVTRTAAKKAQLLKLGADHVIVTDEEDLVARVNEITSGKDARIAFDPIGGKILESLAEVAAPKGIIFEYGALVSEPTPYPLIDKTFAFTEIVEAHRYMESNAQIGKIVVTL
jgi:NADPH:quinone reductase-like Zn-dependent oxidoreductase